MRLIFATLKLLWRHFLGYAAIVVFVLLFDPPALVSCLLGLAGGLVDSFVTRYEKLKSEARIAPEKPGRRPIRSGWPTIPEVRPSLAATSAAALWPSHSGGPVAAASPGRSPNYILRALGWSFGSLLLIYLLFYLYARYIF